MKIPKWYDASENLVPGDIIYFKLNESKMSATWRLGKVEKVKYGADGFVRQVIVSYKDTNSDNPDDWIHRAVSRPVRNVIKLFHIEETNFMEEIADAYKLAEDILNSKKMSNYPINELNSDDMNYENISNNDEVDINLPSSNKEVPFNPNPKKQRKKRSTEVERLGIDMKGWNYFDENAGIEPHISHVFRSHDVFDNEIFDKDLVEKGDVDIDIVKDLSDIGSSLENEDTENLHYAFDTRLFLL